MKFTEAQLEKAIIQYACCTSAGPNETCYAEKHSLTAGERYGISDA
jgi:hypothetical protein